MTEEASVNGSGSLAEALVAAQAEMPTVKKDESNPHFGSRFMSLQALIEETRPVLNRHGLAIVQLPLVSELGPPMLQTQLLHGPSGQRLVCDTPLMLSRNDMQGFGSAVTYARRYAWQSLLGIAADDDDDGNAAAAPQPPPQEPQVKAATRAQIGKLGALVDQHNKASVPLPSDYPEAEGWVDVLRRRLIDEYGVSSRKDLTSKQASELIDWLEAEAIPF